MNESNKRDRLIQVTALRELMNKSGITAVKLASKTGFHPGTIHRVLNGTHSISRRMAKELSAFFNVEPDYLLSLNAKKKDKEDFQVFYND